MKIAITTHAMQRIGGVETYLSDIIPALRQAGHELIIACERGAISPGGDAIDTRGFGVDVLAADAVGVDPVDGVHRWRPDVVYAHGMLDPRLEWAIARLAPSVFFIHNYHGTCISGMKRFAFPVMRPCTRTFGFKCFAHYLPRRCGGLSPITMWRQFWLQRARLAMVRRCDAVVTHSFHMYSEFARHGVDIDRLHRFVYYSAEQIGGAIERAPTFPLPIAGDPSSSTSAMSNGSDEDMPLQLTFAGRLDRNKGVQMLIAAAPLAARQLRRRLHVNILGEGPARAQFERLAKRAAGDCPQVTFTFTGWLNREAVADHLRRTDLVVFPSVWPEPFGLVGPEAGNLGIPVAAFAVGGVTGWLVDDVNGQLAPADPPTAAGLASAIARCLRDPQTYMRLKRGAFEMATRFNRASHLSELSAVFDSVLHERGNRAGATASAEPSGTEAATVAVTR